MSNEHLMLLPIQDSKQNYLDGFWRWVGILADDDYEQAFQALYWPKGTSWTPDSLKQRIRHFFGGSAPWSVVVPNSRLVTIVNDAADFQPPIQEAPGWFLAQIPLTTEPDSPLRDDLPLMGLATSFFVRRNGANYVLELEIFHA